MYTYFALFVLCVAVGSPREQSVDVLWTRCQSWYKVLLWLWKYCGENSNETIHPKYKKGRRYIFAASVERLGISREVIFMYMWLKMWCFVKFGQIHCHGYSGCSHSSWFSPPLKINWHPLLDQHNLLKIHVPISQICSCHFVPTHRYCNSVEIADIFTSTLECAIWYASLCLCTVLEFSVTCWEWVCRQQSSWQYFCLI